MITYCINGCNERMLNQENGNIFSTKKQKKKKKIDISQNLIYLNHQLIKNNCLVSLGKLDSKELYNIIIFDTKSTPTSQIYFENLFPHNNFDWKSIYLLPRLVARDSHLRAFQYKILKI